MKVNMLLDKMLRLRIDYKSLFFFSFLFFFFFSLNILRIKHSIKEHRVKSILLHGYSNKEQVKCNLIMEHTCLY